MKMTGNVALLPELLCDVRNRRFYKHLAPSGAKLDFLLNSVLLLIFDASGGPVPSCE